VRIEGDNLVSSATFHIVKQTEINPSSMLSEKNISQLLKTIIVSNTCP